MTSLAHHFSARLRRRLTLALALAVLFAGFAQAAHFHKDELAGHESQTDIHCLLCLFAAGSATPPVAAALKAAPVPTFHGVQRVAMLPPRSRVTASYDARGPPV